MSTQRNLDDIIKHKKEAIRSLNTLLESYISSKNPELLKKADLISYWIKSFSMYVDSEETFTPTKLLRYPRGSVLRVNFGFNIGKEFGGLHYAVVIDNDNKRNAHAITVVPLSSSDGKSVHERNVDLGKELYEKIRDNQKKLYSKALEESKGLYSTLNLLSENLSLLQSIRLSNAEVDFDIMEKIDETLSQKKQYEEKKASYERKKYIYERNEKEIAKLKTGSMAIVNQITTISKQRIYTPKRSEDFLDGISLSAPAMEKINEKIKSLYLFDK